MISASSTIKKIVFLIVLNHVSDILLNALVLVLILEGFFDFLYSWPLVLSYLFILLLTVLTELILEFWKNILSAFILSSIFRERHCTRRVCISEAPKTGLEGLGEMRHVKKYDVVDTLLFSVGLAMFPFIIFVLRGVTKGVYPPDVFLFSMVLFSWTFLCTFLVRLMLTFRLKFRAYRYAEDLSFRETLQKLIFYTDEKKFERDVFHYAILTLAMYWFFNWLVYIMENPWLDLYHVLTALFVTVTSLVVLAVVVGWALDVFTRRLFGEALGKFLFATFVVGAVFHPFLGVVTSFLFSWAMFGRARDAVAATAITALSLFAVMLPGLIWTSALLL
jgi:hypothetical protein